ncbi:R3H and coiled-coil domain-containing protein 1-like isoform X1 [Anguilla anguilla]|uniref:R3H and coiled-coil domain-containing protein 1-like isoform X1 n=2 Tax=Anguilla anguilla TaxID=7936 RepID=UPI0015B17D55|nr:R3H and coiled-coil domain-containing protein 1-like isoform X1 [Anguilla anguilla]
MQQRVSAFSTVTLAFPSDVCYLPRQENEFIHKIFEDLEILLQRDAQNSVLIFPPLPSRLCDLIQKTIENYSSLCTFSVGEGRSRRMVVCHSDLRISSEDDGDEGGRRYKQPLGLVTGNQYWKDKHYPRPRTIQMNSRDQREPDKAIFSPGALWEMDSATRAISSLSVSEESCSDTTEESLAANQDAQSDGSDHVTCEHDAFVNLDRSGLGPWPPSWDQSVSYFKAMSWDYSPGDACDNTALPAPAPQMNGVYISEITTNLKEQDVVILSARNDYSCYENARVDAEAFGHILEIYNISPMFRTEDLLDAFAGFSARGLEIHWVDGTHALAVFSCKAAALQALSIKHPLIRARKLSSGTKKSKGKALRLSELLRPVNEEAQTDPRPVNEEAQTDPKVSKALDLHVQHCWCVSTNSGSYSQTSRAGQSAVIEMMVHLHFLPSVTRGQ